MSKKHIAATFILVAIASMSLYRASIVDKVIQQKDDKCRDIATLNRIPLSDYNSFMQSCIDGKLPLY